MFINHELTVNTEDYFLHQKDLCVGLNYADHAKSLAIPFQTNLLFLIVPSSLSFAGAIILPEQLTASTMRGNRSCHWKRRTQCPKRTSDDLCSRYCCGNDVSARDWQKGKPAGQWFLGKSFDCLPLSAPAYYSRRSR